MSKIGIITSSATSLKVVSETIASVLDRNGHKTSVFSHLVKPSESLNLFEKAIIVMTYDPIYIPPYCLNAMEYMARGIPTLMYVTVEGVPKKLMVRDWMKKRIRYVANSKYTADMLGEVGIQVEKIIHHGVDIYDFRGLSKTIAQFKKNYMEVLGVDVLFGTVSSNHPRKNLETLAKVIEMASENLKGAGFVVVTTEDAESMFSRFENCFVVPRFGKMKRKEVLAIMGSFDFLIIPSLSEGFGLPALEAQALGVIPIHGDYEPLTEITVPEASFRIPISEVALNSFEDGIMYTLHYYTPEAMFEQVKKAYELYVSNKEEYDKMRSIVKKQASKFDANKLYSEFIKLL